jgi:hypothetical protein
MPSEHFLLVYNNIIFLLADREFYNCLNWLRMRFTTCLKVELQEQDIFVQRFPSYNYAVSSFV